MACALTQGYDFTGCKGGAGGISEVLITEYANVTATAVTSGVYTTITMASGKQFRRYNLDMEMGTTNDPFAYTMASGSRVYAPKIGFQIKGFSTAVQLEIELLSKNHLIMIVKYNNGLYRMFGIEKGMNLMTVADDSGKAYEDFNGFDLAFEGKSTIPAMAVSSSIITALLSPAA